MSMHSPLQRVKQRRDGPLISEITQNDCSLVIDILVLQSLNQSWNCALVSNSSQDVRSVIAVLNDLPPRIGRFAPSASLRPIWPRFLVI